MRRILLPLLALIAALALPALAARDKGRNVDLITTAPDFAGYDVRAIAMLPVATFDGNVLAERQVATQVGQSLRGTKYRWISSGTSREMLMATVGDSGVKAVREQILRNVRVDSLEAGMLCSRLRTDAVLCVRVDQWEQLQILWNQAGKPATTVALKAALVDSTGRLLWSASGSETGEGPYHDPNTNPISVNSASLENTPVTGQGGPPTYEDVLPRMLTRWAPQFPARVEAMPADSTK